MSGAYSDRAQWAREWLARSSPGAARAMRARELEAARLYRTVDDWRWDRIDRAAQEAIDAQAPLVEAWLPAEESEVVDEEVERRRVSLARARMRARTERQQVVGHPLGNRQNDKSRPMS